MKRHPTIDPKKEPLHIIIGSFILEQDYSYALREYAKRGLSVSNAQYEKKLIRGFEDNDLNYVFLSAPSVGGWPFLSKRPFVRGFTSTSHILTTPYFAPYGLTNYFKGKALIKSVKRVLRQEARTCKNRPIHVVCCEAHKPYLVAAKWIKTHRPKTCFSTLIVPDLPSDMRKTNRAIYRFFKKKDIESIKKICEGFIDGYLCFTTFIAETFKYQEKPMKIMEGIVCSAKENQMACLPKKAGDIHCVFVGKTDERNGVPTIIEAAKKAPSNLHFDIYGSGDMDDQLLECEIPNLHFFGFLNPMDVSTVLSNADVVLSPRKAEGGYIYTSFPSKVFDYIEYGKKVVTYKLPCYFPKLDEVFFYPENYSAESLLKAIANAIAAEEGHVKEIYAQIASEYSPSAAVHAICELYNEYRGVYDSKLDPKSL